MSIWFFINGIVLLCLLLKIFFGPFLFYRIVGGLGMLFILYNWTRQAFYATIRSSISRRKKIRLANISKAVLPFHKWTGTTALLLIILHLYLVMRYFPFDIQNMKILTGLLAFISLILLVLFGWLRFIRTTVARRYIHWTLAYIVFFSTIIHIFFV